VKDQKGRLDILFANAGIGEFAPSGEISEEHLTKHLVLTSKEFWSL